MLSMALLVLSLSVQVSAADQIVDKVHYATESEKVVLRNWTPPANLEYASDNTVTPVYVASVATALNVVHPVRIGREVGCING